MTPEKRTRLIRAILRCVDARVIFVPIGIPEDDDPEQVYLKKIDSSREVWQDHIAPVFGNEFERERQDIVPTVRAASTPDVAGARIDQAITESRRHWAATIASVYFEVSKAFGPRTLAGFRRAGFKHKAPTIDPWQAAAARFLRKNGAKKVVDITATTRKQIRKILADGAAAGDSVAKIADRIDELYLEQIIPNRSMVIARTEVLEASSLVNQEAARVIETPMDKIWLSIRDGRERPTHLEAHRQRVPLSEPYEINGQPLMYPGDSSLGADPGETIQCRCAEIYEESEKPRARSTVVIPSGAPNDLAPGRGVRAPAPASPPV